MQIKQKINLNNETQMKFKLNKGNEEEGEEKK